MTLLAALAVAAAAVLGGFYLGQHRLIFFPQPLTAPPRVPPDVEEILHTAADGTRLHGWLAKSGRPRAPLLIYFGGNAEEVSWLLRMRPHFDGWSMLLINYRGYGLSAGSPGEAALLADALEIFDLAAARPDVNARHIAVMGRSLGSGVAVHVAARRPVAGVVLVSPYDSLGAVARRHYPFLPISVLLRHHFDSLALAPDIRAPLLCVVGERDSLIPPVHSRRLCQAWGGAWQWRELPGAGHGDISDRPEYWSDIRAFLLRLVEADAVAHAE